VHRLRHRRVRCEQYKIIEGFHSRDPLVYTAAVTCSRCVTSLHRRYLSLSLSLSLFLRYIFMESKSPFLASLARFFSYRSASLPFSPERSSSLLLITAMLISQRDRTHARVLSKVSVTNLARYVSSEAMLRKTDCSIKRYCSGGERKLENVRKSVHKIIILA